MNSPESADLLISAAVPAEQPIPRLERRAASERDDSSVVDSEDAGADVTQSYPERLTAYVLESQSVTAPTYCSGSVLSTSEQPISCFQVYLDKFLQAIAVPTISEQLAGS